MKAGLGGKTSRSGALCGPGRARNLRPSGYEQSTLERCAHLQKRRSAASTIRMVIRSLRSSLSATPVTLLALGREEPLHLAWIHRLLSMAAVWLQ